MSHTPWSTPAAADVNISDLAPGQVVRLTYGTRGTPDRWWVNIMKIEKIENSYISDGGSGFCYAPAAARVDILENAPTEAMSPADAVDAVARTLKHLAYTKDEAIDFMHRYADELRLAA